MCLEGELLGGVQGREGVLLGVTPGGSGGGTLGMHVAKLLVQSLLSPGTSLSQTLCKSLFSDSVAGLQGTRHLLRIEGPMCSQGSSQCRVGWAQLGVCDSALLLSGCGGTLHHISVLHFLPVTWEHALEESCAGTPTTGTSVPH